MGGAQMALVLASTHAWQNRRHAQPIELNVWLDQRRALLPLLLRGPDEHLVDCDAARPGHYVGDDVGDVSGLEDLHRGESLGRLLADLLAQMRCQLGPDRTRFDR